jgi:hypothetical protein
LVLLILWLGAADPLELCCWHIGLVLLAHWLGAAGFNSVPMIILLIYQGGYFFYNFFCTDQ